MSGPTFSVNAGKLAAELSFVNRAVGQREPIETLSHVLIRPNADPAIVLTATDLTIAARAIVPATLHALPGPGFTLPASKLLDLAKSIDGESSIQFEQLAKTVKIRAERFVVEWTSFREDDFSPVADVDNAARATIRPSLLAQHLRICTTAVGEDSSSTGSRNAVRLIAKQGTLTSGAVDGYRVAHVTSPVAEELPALLLPRRAISEVIALCESASDDAIIIGVQGDSSRASFACGARSVISRLIDDTFPSLAQLLSKPRPHVLTIDRKALIAGVQRALLSAGSLHKLPAVTMAFQDEQITISSTSADIGASEEPIKADGKSESLVFNLRARYLLDALKSFQSSVVTIAASSAREALAIAPGEGEIVTALYIVMPFVR